MSETHQIDPPSPFVERCLTLAMDATGGSGKRRALDVAMGRGRHTLILADGGWNVFGVDSNLAAIEGTVARARATGHRVHAWCADLTDFPLPRDRFELIVVTRYLQRGLFAALRDALTVGGMVVYETFTTAQRSHGRGPISPDHLLAPGELREWFAGFEVLFYEEVTEPEASARLYARKRFG